MDGCNRSACRVISCGFCVLSLLGRDQAQIVIGSVGPRKVIQLLLIGAGGFIEFSGNVAIVGGVDGELLAFAGMVAQLERPRVVLRCPSELAEGVVVAAQDPVTETRSLDRVRWHAAR